MSSSSIANARQKAQRIENAQHAAAQRSLQYAQDGSHVPVLELLHALHLESGFCISANSEQLAALSAEGLPPSDPKYKACVAAAKGDIEKYCVVTPADIKRMVADYNKHMDPQRPLLACACCGVRDPDRSMSTPICVKDLAPHHWLRCSEDEVAELAAAPTVSFLTSQGQEREVHLKLLRSWYAADTGEYFHLHKELVYNDAKTGASMAPLCEACSKAAADPSGPPPATSIAAGCDYGLLSRLGLEPPSAFEVLLLADVRTYALTAKVHVPGQWCAARELLRGHMIAFVHDGPAILSKHFDEARMENALAHLPVIFVGSSGRQTRLEKRALAIPDLQLRLYALFNYFLLKHALRQEKDATLPDFAAISALVTEAMRTVIERARHIADDTAEVHALPSDVANVPGGRD